MESDNSYRLKSAESFCSTCWKKPDRDFEPKVPFVTCSECGNKFVKREVVPSDLGSQPSEASSKAETKPHEAGHAKDGLQEEEKAGSAEGNAGSDHPEQPLLHQEQNPKKTSTAGERSADRTQRKRTSHGRSSPRPSEDPVLPKTLKSTYRVDESKFPLEHFSTMPPYTEACLMRDTNRHDVRRSGDGIPLEVYRRYHDPKERLRLQQGPVEGSLGLTLNYNSRLGSGRIDPGPKTRQEPTSFTVSFTRSIKISVNQNEGQQLEEIGRIAHDIDLFQQWVMEAEMRIDREQDDRDLDDLHQDEGEEAWVENEHLLLRHEENPAEDSSLIPEEQKQPSSDKHSQLDKELLETTSLPEDNSSMPQSDGVEEDEKTVADTDSPEEQPKPSQPKQPELFEYPDDPEQPEVPEYPEPSEQETQSSKSGTEQVLSKPEPSTYVGEHLPPHQETDQFESVPSPASPSTGFFGQEKDEQEILNGFIRNNPEQDMTLVFEKLKIAEQEGEAIVLLEPEEELEMDETGEQEGIGQFPFRNLARNLNLMRQEEKAASNSPKSQQDSTRHTQSQSRSPRPPVENGSSNSSSKTSRDFQLRPTSTFRHISFSCPPDLPRFEELFERAAENTASDNFELFTTLIREMIGPKIYNQNLPTAIRTILTLPRIRITEEILHELEADSPSQEKKLSPKTPLSCLVCFCDFQIREEAIILWCKHFFHSSCVLVWLSKNNTCPTCRFRLPGERV